MNRGTRRTVLAIASLALIACGDPGGLSDARRPAALQLAVAPTKLVVVSGDSQHVGITQENPLPVVVQVSDGSGPLAGVTVDFGPLGTNPGASVSAAHVVTDAAGLAATRWHQGQVAGVQSLGVQVGDILSTLAFAIVAPGPPAKLRASVEDPHLTTADSSRTYLYASVTDQYDNPVDRVPVTFVVDSGGGSLQSLNADTTRNGGATRLWWLGPLARRNVAHAEAAGMVSLPAVTVGVIGGFRILQGDSQRTRPNQAVPAPIRVQATNVQGKLLGAGFPLFFWAITPTGALALVDSAVTDPSGQASTVSPWILGPTEGWYRLLAQAEYEGPFTTIYAFAVAPRPERIVVRTGAGAHGAAGNFLALRPEVEVRDSAGFPMAGQPVFFETIGPAGDARGYLAQRTDSLGRARIPGWRLSGVPGTNQVRVTTPGLPPAPITLTATGDSLADRRFEITTRFDGVFPIATAPSVADAAREWGQAILGDLPDIAVDLPADPGRCHPAVHTLIDDLLVYIHVASIDGPNGTTATSRVCRFRPGSTLPLIVQIEIDHDDLGLIDDRPGGLPLFFRHMLGHALGIGTTWPVRRDLADSLHLTFSGASATSAYNWLRWTPGTALDPAEAVPLGLGADWIHWAGSLPDVMNGTPAFGSPIGALSLAALRDLGYAVDDSHQRSFQTPAAAGPLPGWGDRPYHSPRRRGALP